MKPQRRTVFATVLFTDIVGSTDNIAELGNRRWQDLLEKHNKRVRGQLRRFGGRELNTAGDAFVAIFSEPASALQCAWAVVPAVRDLGIELRCGLHLGQVEGIGGAAGGLAVHVSARIATVATPGEILVSSAIRDAVAGAGFAFENRGSHSLKGLPGEWELTALSGLPSEVTPHRVRSWTSATFSRQDVAAGLAGIILVLAGIYLVIRGSAEDRSPTGKPSSVQRSSGTAPAHRQLTFLGDAQMPALSPDGQYFAYVAGRFGKAQRLLVQATRGGPSLELARHLFFWSVRWAPDGTELLYIAADSSAGLYSIPRLGGPERHIRVLDSAFASAASWSPDGQQIVTANNMSKRLVFTTMATGDTASVPLPEGLEGVMDLDWAREGGRLAVLAGELSQERGWLTSIWAVQVDGSRAAKVITDTLRLLSPRWSPDGKTLYYLRDTEQAKDLMAITITREERATNASDRPVLTGLQASDEISLSTVGQRLLYTSGLKPSRMSWYGWHSNLRLVRAVPATAGSNGSVVDDGRQLTTGTALKWLPSFSPDGREIAVAIGGYRTANIFVISVADGNARQLTYLKGFSSGPVWSRDGREIAFGSSHGGSVRVWVVSASGGSPRVFEQTQLAESYQLNWAPGERILYQPVREGAPPRILDPNTGSESALVHGDTLGYWGLARYSADGGSVVAFWSPPEGFEHEGEPPTGLYLVPSEGGRPRLIYREPRTFGLPTLPLGWRADGQEIYAWPLTSRQILAIPLPSGEPRLTTQLPCEEPLSWVTMAPDGEHFLCDVGEATSDIWLVEHFDSEASSAVN